MFTLQELIVHDHYKDKLVGLLHSAAYTNLFVVFLVTGITVLKGINS